MTLGDGAWQDVLAELTAQLDRPVAQSFFRGARVLLETGERSIGVKELEELIALFSQHQMELISVVGDATTQAAFNQLRSATPQEPRAADAPLRPAQYAGRGESTSSEGLATLPAPESLEPEDLTSSENPPSEKSKVLVIQRTVRSGQSIRHSGMVVIIGDVNPGAEVIAEGDVLVWGRLRGVVHAGASGNENAIVSALFLSPTQLRIGRYIARSPEEKQKYAWPAEIAHVRDGQIIVEPWSG